MHVLVFDLSKVKKKPLTKIHSIFNDEKLKKLIVKNDDLKYIVRIPFFDAVESHLERKREFSNVTLTLAKIEQNKLKRLMKNIKIKSPEYDKMIRALRF